MYLCKRRLHALLHLLVQQLRLAMLLHRLLQPSLVAGARKVETLWSYSHMPALIDTCVVSSVDVRVATLLRRALRSRLFADSFSRCVSFSAVAVSSRFEAADRYDCSDSFSFVSCSCSLRMVLSSESVVEKGNT